MQQANLNIVLEQVGKDKGIDRAVLVETLEQAILSAAKKTFGQHRELEARYNEETGSVDLFLVAVVMDDEEAIEPGLHIPLSEARKNDLEAEPGDELLFQIFYRPEDQDKAKKQDKEYGDLLDLKTHRRGFGRIAAQTAKQVIIQRVREAERENIYNEYKDRKGELITGIVRRFERGNIIVDLGRAESVLPVKEQVPRESYRAGDRIQAYVLDIDRAARGPQIILSRTHKGLLEKLFEMEVPEIYEKIVRIESSAREPGARSKIAVTSMDRDVDPVGACVGMKGSRVQAVVQELRGEKIDIVPYDDDPARFVCNAISPAEVLRVLIDAENHTMELIVPDDKLSLAIGKKGQNVRLASQLSGWRIDIHSETKVREMEENSRRSIASIEGVGEDLAETMFRLGWRSAGEVANANPEELANIPGLGGLEAAKTIAEAATVAIELEARRKEEERRIQLLALQELDLVDEELAERLLEAGYRTVPDIHAESDVERLFHFTGLQMPDVQQLKDNAAAWMAENQPEPPPEEEPTEQEEGSGQEPASEQEEAIGDDTDSPEADEERPMAGGESPKAGEESPKAGEESPKAGEESPKAGEEGPKAGEKSPEAGEESPKAGEESTDIQVAEDGQNPSGVDNGGPRGDTAVSVKSENQ